jgi:hypothetical protein
MDIIDNVGKYLEDEKVFLDMDEFRFQCKSHPDYPSFGVTCVRIKTQ